MIFPKKDIIVDKKLIENETIQERVVYEEKMLEEKTMKIVDYDDNDNNPYKQLEIHINDDNRPMKDEYKQQFDIFLSNFQKFNTSKYKHIKYIYIYIYLI